MSTKIVENAKVLSYSFYNFVTNPAGNLPLPTSEAAAWANLAYYAFNVNMYQDPYWLTSFISLFNIQLPSFITPYYGTNKTLYRFSLFNSVNNSKSDQLIWIILGYFFA